MQATKNGKNFRLSDGPNPVGDVVGQATPDRQQATGTPLVSSQAGGVNWTTGNDGSRSVNAQTGPGINEARGEYQGVIPDANQAWQTDPSIRRSSLSRTPVKDRKHLFSMSETEDDYYSPIQTPKRVTEEEARLEEEVSGMIDEDLEDSPSYKLYGYKNNADAGGTKSPLKKKRKRDKEDKATNGNDKEMSDVIKAVEILTKKAEELRKLVKESTKTKTEIKTATWELHGIVGNLNKKMNVLKAKQDTIATYDDKKQEEKQTRQETRTISTQVCEEDIRTELSVQNGKIQREIEAALEQKVGWPGLSKFLDQNWPDSCFKNTEVLAPEALKEEKGDIAVIMNPKTTPTGGTMEELKHSFPGISTILQEGLKEGIIEYAKTNTVTTLSRGKEEVTSRTLYILPYELNKEGVNDIQKLHEVMGKLNAEMITHGSKHTKLIAMGKLDIDYLRKCTEYVFRGTGITVGIIGQRRFRSKLTSTRDRPKTEKLIIKADGKSYSEVLRSIKGSVNIGDIGVTVKSVKKTAKGDVMLELQGGEHQAETFKKAVQGKDQNMQVHIQSNDVTIHISGIDGDMSNEEIEEELIKSVGNANAEDVKVLSSRPNQRGNLNATLSIKKELARDIIERGRVKIGWAQCRVNPHVNITRCYRCLKFGHITKDCTGEDNTRICIKCGKEDHRAKDCKNTSFCLTCKKDGHRADQTKCPTYRKLLKERQDAVGRRRRFTSTASEIITA
jgi:Zinc knuckle